jgi:hypothetical protein
MDQPLPPAQPQSLGLGIHVVDFPERLKHLAGLVGKLLSQAYELTPSVAKTMSEDGV